MSGGGGMREGPFGCELFYLGQCVLWEWVVRGGLCRHFGEQRLPVGVLECLERFHRRCVDYLSRQLVPKWNSSNGESVVTKASTTSLLVELIGAAASFDFISIEEAGC